jgi:hypothetical protein
MTSLTDQNHIGSNIWLLKETKGATNILSKGKNISLLIEIHTLQDGTNSYKQIIEFLSLYNFKVEFEKTYVSGEKYIIVRKSSSLTI